MAQVSRPSQKSTKALLRDIARRVETLERHLIAGRTRDFRSRRGDSALRWNIIEEDRLRREIEREQMFRREQPVEWRRRERERLFRNREHADVDRRLRAVGLRARIRELSLKQKMQKLKQLEARNRAETTIFRKAK